MATKFFTVCRHTGPALPHGTSGKIVVIGSCPKCLEKAHYLSQHKPETTIQVSQALLNSYRKVRTSR